MDQTNLKTTLKGFLGTLTGEWKPSPTCGLAKLNIGDSMGNKGVIKSGDVQWMTAGSGIIHQEMPKKYDGLMQGFQLWVNLPAKKKMINPKYRGIEKEQIPMVQKDGMKIKVVAGEIDGTWGIVRDLAIDIEYFDVELTSGKTFEHSTAKDDTVFAYIVEVPLRLKVKP